MATRAPPKRAPPTQKATSGGDGIQFKLLVRDEALQVKDIPETKTSAIYDICRVKANQVMMMKRRGYRIPEDEMVWLEAAVNEDTLIRHIQTLKTLTAREIVKLFRKTYTISRTFIPDQTTFNFYPYLEEEGSGTLKIGEFFFQGGKWRMTRDETQLTETREYETEVEYTDTIRPETFGNPLFSPVASRLIVYTDSEKNFQQEVMKNMIEFRKRGVETFHMSELFVDYFQHWLVPHQRVIGDLERIQLLSPYLMIRDSEGNYQKEFNSRIVETGLPSIHHTDIVMRYIGAIPGKIIYWENESYISSFSTKEFGYMLVAGYKYKTAASQAEDMFAGEQRQGEDVGEVEDVEDIEDIEEVEDIGGDLGDDED
ncbi:MAG: hypothetical protein VKK63_07655 [Synechococcus sp.]|nr:hypothetical protein [Synechococcus sp.]